MPTHSDAMLSLRSLKGKVTTEEKQKSRCSNDVVKPSSAQFAKDLEDNLAPIIEKRVTVGAHTAWELGCRQQSTQPPTTRPQKHRASRNLYPIYMKIREHKIVYNPKGRPSLVARNCTELGLVHLVLGSNRLLKVVI
jgi:hypothetical protein